MQIKRFYSAQDPTLIPSCTCVESETLTISSRVFYSHVCDYFLISFPAAPVMLSILLTDAGPAILLLQLAVST